jgi:hypothetical protein
MTSTEVPRGDALSRFRQAQHRMSGRRFEAGEHQWLGREGLFLACEQFGLSKTPYMRLKRRDGDEQFSYGELVALSGDFYGSPKALFEEESSLLPWLYEENDLDDLRKAFQEELAWIEDEERGLNVGYPDNSLALVWNSKSMLELVLDNNVHFGWHNIVAYCRHHAEALDLARKADQQNDKDPTWRRAVFYNAFADHFLTDAFAAGHVRVPREQIRKWATRKDWSEKIAGGLSKVLHDQDGHVNTNHSRGERYLADEGLWVANSLGANWFTRCDGQLFIVKPTHDLLIEQPVQAVAKSLLELFTSRRDRTLPEGIYQALVHVPFPHPNVQSLCDKFSPTMPRPQFEGLIESISWYLKIPWIGSGVNEENLRMLLAALPELMTEFRHDVKTTYEGSSELQKRIPAPYVNAFMAIH